MKKLQLFKLFNSIEKYFSPKIIGEVNDTFIKIVKVKGQDVPWHIHDREDELFLVLKGRLCLEFKNHPAVFLRRNDMYIVEHGVEHRVYSKKECRLLLVEKKTTKHTGDIVSSITKTVEEQHY